MKHPIRYAVSFVILSCFAGCSKYINKLPLDQFTDPAYWSSEDNVKSFCWGFYNDLFSGYGNGNSFGTFYFTSFSDDQDNPDFEDFPKNAPASDDYWGFSDIRKANLVLSRVDIVPMDDDAKSHWKGVARFFRAFNYFLLVKRFGDVQWYGSVLDVSDTAVYKARDPRNTVMDSVLADLDFAVDNLRVKGDADANTVNKDVALALKARICLYEGTYSEYREGDKTRAAKYLKEAKDAAKQLLSAGYVLNSDFRAAYNSEDLSSNKEIILYKEYEDAVLMQSLVGYNNATTPYRGLTKSAIESFPCADGLPITLSADYKGDATIDDVLANRDGRLKNTIADYYCYNGNLVYGMHSSTAYRPVKFLPPGVNKPGDYTSIPYNTTDAPLFWLAETMVNYAEAAAELDNVGGEAITQSDLDISVNELRTRDSVRPLQLSGHQGTAVGGTPFVDPAKDADVTSLVWEIRRERRCELMMDGFRYDDLIRWGKLYYMDSQKNPDCFLGAKVAPNDQITVNAQGYIQPYASTVSRTVLDRDYLYPIPTNEISLYPAALQADMQNPGW